MESSETLIAKLIPSFSDRSKLEIVAARTLSAYAASPRKVISVEFSLYKLLLYKLKPIRLVIQQEEVKFVLLDRIQTINFLKNEFNLQNDMSLLRNRR